MKNWFEPNLPTRERPHRYCRQMHHVWNLVVLAISLPILMNGWTIMLAIAMGVMFAPIERFVWKGKSQHERAMEEALQQEFNERDVSGRHVIGGEPVDPLRKERTVFPGGLVVDRVWARIALGADAFMMAVGLAAVYRTYSSPQGFEALTHWVPSPPGISGLVEFLVVVAILVFHQYAHYRATHDRPRRVLRSRAKAFAFGGGKA